MAEVAVEPLETIAIAVDPEIHLPPVSSIKSDLEEDNKENSKATSEAVIVEGSVKKVNFECVDLEDGDSSDEDGDDEDDDNGRNENIQKKKRLKKKKAKHILIEDESSSDEDTKRAMLMDVNPSDLTWVLWMWYYITSASSGALKAAEYLGEKLAAFFGITTPKYQYVIDEYYRLKELEREEEEKEQKEKELIAERKMEDLSRLEGGGANCELNKPC